MTQTSKIILAMIATAIIVGGGVYYRQSTTQSVMSQTKVPTPETITAQISQKSFAEYFATRDQFLNTGMMKDGSGMNKSPEALGFKEMAKVEVTCPDSAGTPCDGQLLILSKKSLGLGNQEFYLVKTMGTGYTYYGPFTDDLQRIVNESKTASLEESNWKTFLGSQFRFSFEYPNDWFITKGSSIETQPEAVFVSKVQLKEGGEDLGNLSIVINKSSLEKNIRENLISREEITFAGRSATKINFTGDWGPAIISILVPYDDYTFVISYDPEDKDYSSIEKILNSFSFETTAQ